MSRKLSLEEITTAGILKEPEHRYLLDYLKTAPDPVGIYEHSARTKTCAEKIALLNSESGRAWELRQAVRAVYFKHGTLLHVVVTPDLGIGRVDTTACFGRTLGCATIAELPPYLEEGTCTPFIPYDDISPAAGRVQHIYAHFKPEFKTMLADFSIGGRGEDAQRRSLWIPYGDAVHLLAKEFDEVVTVQDIYTLPPKAERSKLIKQASGAVKYGR
jgi:hypothetical protein